MHEIQEILSASIFQKMPILVVPEKGLPAGEITGKLGEIGKTSVKMAILFCKILDSCPGKLAN
jgi:hypothetical protein